MIRQYADSLLDPEIKFRVLPGTLLEAAKREAALVCIQEVAIVSFEFNGQLYRVYPTAIMDQVLPRGPAK
jgi:hypothetical protein